METNQKKNPFQALSDAMADAVEKAASSTVLVDGRRRIPASGIGYQSNLVITADHVVEREQGIPVLMPDGNQAAAEVAGRDPQSDLALLRIDADIQMPALPAKNEARVGQIVLALGRPSAEGIQASLGVISAVGGPVRIRRGALLEGYLRTDAIPYPGFSGGPLVNADGLILGLNTSGLTRGGSLTIPVSTVWQVAETLFEHGQVRRGFLGIRSQPVTIPSAQQASLGRGQKTGLLLVSVEENSPAAAAGLLVGDILVGFAGKPVAEADVLLSRLAGSVVGQISEVEILRAGQLQSIEVKIGMRE